MNAAQPDLIKIFFDDIANIEPLAGRADYLPLIRRVERGRLLLSLARSEFGSTFENVQSALNRGFQRFNRQCREVGAPELDPSDLGTQIDEFLDDPKTLIPLALSHSLGNRWVGQSEAYAQFSKLGWRCMYLLALFPSAERSQPLTCSPNDAIREHFRLVSQERQEAQQRLVEGTIRYVVRLAAHFTGRGLPYLDLVQEGYFGLHHAVNRFVEAEGGNFQQYAAQWIQQRMSRAVAEQSRLIRTPVHLAESLAKLERLEHEYDNDIVLDPYARDSEIIVRLGLATAEAVTKKQVQAKGKLKKIREARARHYSIDSHGFDELLVDLTEHFEHVDSRSLKRQIERWLTKCRDRDQDVIRERFGLLDDQQKTLDEVGQIFGVTRERIRQIEAKMLERVRRNPSRHGLEQSMLESGNHSGESLWNELRPELHQRLDRVDMRESLRPDPRWQARRDIEARIGDTEMRRGNRTNGRRKQSRAEIAIAVLEEAGQPLHYVEIHQRMLTRIAADKPITKESAYAVLFYDDRFRQLGGGVYSLASWQSVSEHTENGRVFAHCPPPLLPANANSRAFLETILIARQIAQVRPGITVTQFFEEMLAQVKRDRFNAQDAFDVWYIVGLHEHIHFERQAREPIRLTIPAEWKLAEVRSHCLVHLSQRLGKIPELLFALERLATTDVPTLQKVLFGSEAAGFDVPLRMTLLAALEAVRADGSNWRITDVGRNALTAHPPQELPDFSVIETFEPEDSVQDDWDDPLAVFML